MCTCLKVIIDFTLLNMELDTKINCLMCIYFKPSRNID